MYIYIYIETKITPSPFNVSHHPLKPPHCPWTLLISTLTSFLATFDAYSSWLCQHPNDTCITIHNLHQARQGISALDMTYDHWPGVWSSPWITKLMAPTDMFSDQMVQFTCSLEFQRIYYSTFMLWYSVSALWHHPIFSLYNKGYMALYLDL